MGGVLGRFRSMVDVPGRLGIRARLIGLGTVGLALALGAGGVGLVMVLRYAVDQSVTDRARTVGEEIVRIAESGELPQPLPVSGDHYVQVVDGGHRVVAASTNADRLVPILRDAEVAGAVAGDVLVVDGSRIGRNGSLRVVAVAVPNHQSEWTVLVATSLSEVSLGTSLLAKALLFAYPLMVAVLAVVGWRVAGAALRPVETLRLGAERITGTGGTSRELLPVPPAHDEIHRLAVTLNDMLGRLAAAQIRQRAFVADAAHELRSPLASMRVQLEVAARLDEHGDLPDDLLADIDRLSRLVDDLLLLARGDEPLPANRSRVVDLAELVEEAAGRYGAARVPVTITLPSVDSPPEVRGRRGELGRAVMNLVDNAVRHARGEVRVAVVPGGEWHVIAVADDGLGIPEADRERVFDRFTRLDEARARDDGGSGLGLAIVREIVHRHGGTVTLTDAVLGLPEAGLRAEVRLPAVWDAEPGGRGATRRRGVRGEGW